MVTKRTALPAPTFTLFDVRYATDATIVARAETLYRQGNVRLEPYRGNGYSAIVQGSQPYQVLLSERAVDIGSCTCYMGQQDQFCKHLLALAFLVLHETGALQQVDKPLTEMGAKAQIAAGARKFTAYNGPSRVWFAYQQRLAVGAGMIQEALPFLPRNKSTISYLWKLVVRFSRKLSHGGIDDSDGTVGDCIGEIITRIASIAKEDTTFLEYAKTYCVTDTGFGFAEDLQAKLR